MTKLVWGDPSDRVYEAGVNKGVLYLSGNSGIPWNGITAIRESPSGGTPKPYYLDGFKYDNIAEAEEYVASLEAYSSPAEFARCDGLVQLAMGLFAADQPRSEFGLSYQTKVANELQSTGYKLHLVYNALASPSSRDHNTLSDSPEPLVLSWGISTRAKRITNARPTAHLIIDSTKSNPTYLAILEEVLYGSSIADARLPEPDEVIYILTYGHISPP